MPSRALLAKRSEVEPRSPEALVANLVDGSLNTGLGHSYLAKGETTHCKSAMVDSLCRLITANKHFVNSKPKKDQTQSSNLAGRCSERQFSGVQESLSHSLSLSLCLSHSLSPLSPSLHLSPGLCLYISLSLYLFPSPSPIYKYEYTYIYIYMCIHMCVYIYIYTPKHT